MVSVLDRGFLYADGFYDTLRIYDGGIFKLPLHLSRIEATAKALEIRLPCSLKKIGELLLETVKRNKLGEARVRITVTRAEKKPTFVITCEALKKSGKPKMLSACTMRFQRIQPEFKTLGGLAVLLPALREAKKRGCDEMIGLDQNGFVREAATSNVFVVRQDTLFTPKSGMLPGLTRSLVVQAAQKLGLEVDVKDFKISVLCSADEIFLTNRVREIIPIVRLNGNKVGKGTLGPVTGRLMEEYREYVEQEVEDAILDSLATARESGKKSKYLSHDDVWK